MSEQLFLTQVEDLFLSIEEWLENLHPDLDFETQESLLTIYLPEDKQMILSRQLALQEVWLACPNGAYHFHLSHDQWMTRNGEEIISVLTKTIKGLTDE